jgi:hypothetical protein
MGHPFIAAAEGRDKQGRLPPDQFEAVLAQIRLLSCYDESAAAAACI